MHFLFIEYYLLLPYVFSLGTCWFLYFKLNNFLIAKTVANTDRLKKKNLFRNIDGRFFTLLTLFYIIILIVNFVILKGITVPIWWQHLLINNSLSSLLFIVFFFNLIVILLLHLFPTLFKKLHYNFLFSIVNISVVVNLIFTANTFFTFFFILEMTSLLIFFKLSSSKFISLNSITGQDYKFFRKNMVNLYAKSYSNMLFFTYWTTFFSSIIFVYIIVFYIFLFNTTEWYFINIFIKNFSFYYFNVKYEVVLLAILTTLAFFLKTGLTPFHLYKIEVYKGIPYISIFFYNTFYFIFYFFLFIFFICINLNELYLIISAYSLYLFALAVVYITSLLFNLNYIKSFFAYSTILNSLLFLFLAFTFLT